MKERTNKLITEFYLLHPDLIPIKTQIEQVANQMITTFEAGGKLLVCGNGGSCADSDHIVGELMKGFLLKRPLDNEKKQELIKHGKELGKTLADKLQGALPAISLGSHPALGSAFANDVDTTLIYAQQVMGYACRDDVVIGISTSGNAENVAAAMVAAKACGAVAIGMTGGTGGRLLELCDVTIIAPEHRTFRIQEYHLAIYHLLCAWVESQLFAT